MTRRPPKVHTQLGRAAVQIFAANERMNQALIDILTLPLPRSLGWCQPTPYLVQS